VVLCKDLIEINVAVENMDKLEVKLTAGQFHIRKALMDEGF
jgi:hypothetical protein